MKKLLYLFFYMSSITSLPLIAEEAITIASHPINTTNHIAIISQDFLGKPYLRNALGEGAHAYFDQRPLFRSDAFDCETLVDTVLALALVYPSNDISEAIKKVRYKHGKVSFLTRNHFTCSDWNINNQEQGFITDITTQIKNQQNQPIFQLATASIDKAEWIQHFSTDNIYLRHASQQQIKQRLKLLKNQSRNLPIIQSTIPYIPLTQLFDANGTPNMFVFKQIPEGAIIEIIRPNWDLTKEIGTHLNVSHLGFAIWSKQILYFREASSKEHKVIDTPLINYLSTFRSSPTIKGINIQKINH